MVGSDRELLMATKPNVLDVKESSHVNRLVLEITGLDSIGEQTGGPTTDVVSVEGIVGSPEGRSLGSPGDVRVREDVPQIWQKITGQRTVIGWQRLVSESSSEGDIVPLLFDVSASGSFDGITNFEIPSPLPARNSAGQHVIAVDAPIGLLDPDSIQALVGAGYWIRSAALNNQNVAVIQALVGLTQPKPSLSVGGDAITHPIFFPFGNDQVNAQPAIRRGPFVPPGFIVQLFCADIGGTPVVGPYELALELESLPRTVDTARAIRSQEFPSLPVTIV